MKKILLIESDESVRGASLEALKGNGYKILETKVPDEALELIRAESPDLIVMPETMPGLDGVELLETLKRENRFAPMIFTSQSGADKQNFRLWSSGAEVVLTGDARELELKIRGVLKE